MKGAVMTPAKEREVGTKCLRGARLALIPTARIVRFLTVLVVVVALLPTAGCVRGTPSAGVAPEAQRPRPLRILISNDDGIDAPGIAALAEALGKIGEVTVAAPMKNQSGTSHAMTANKLIVVKEGRKDGQRWAAIDALPATCVRLALDTLLPAKPDIVVSGINRGENLGVVTFYSATVACAREAAFQGIPAVAVNLENGEGMNYLAAADFTAALIRSLTLHGLKRGVYLNINVPALPRQGIKGVLITRQDRRPAVQVYEKQHESQDEARYWATYTNLEPGLKGTDIWAVRNGYISIAPLGIDQTASPQIEELRRLENITW